MNRFNCFLFFTKIIPFSYLAYHLINTDEVIGGGQLQWTGKLNPLGTCSAHSVVKTTLITKPDHPIEDAYGAKPVPYKCPKLYTFQGGPMPHLLAND